VRERDREREKKEKERDRERERERGSKSERKREKERVREKNYKDGKNINGAPKLIKQYNHYCSQYCDSYIGLFTIAPCRVIAFNLLCLIFAIISLLLFFLCFFSFFASFLFIAFALPTIVRAIFVAYSCSKRE
jgi:hypothetical protein